MISIITPVFNSDKFIEACITNVIEQNCDTAEHLIIDGGSTDATVQIIQQYARRYPHIRWISEKDQGQSDAMNKGIRMAKGEIIGILNADDYYEPGTLNRIKTLFPGKQVPAMLVGNCNFWNKEGHLMYLHKPKRISLYKILASPIAGNPFPSNSSMYFYHRSLHEKIGYYKIDEHYAMDFDFILRAVQTAHVDYVDETWGNFCYHETSKTFQDRRKGASQERVKHYMKLYRQALPWYKHLSASFLHAYYENEPLQKIRYYFTHLDQFLVRLKTKIFQPQG